MVSVVEAIKEEKLIRKIPMDSVIAFFIIDVFNVSIYTLPTTMPYL